MTWIKTIPYDEAEGKLRSLYDRVKGPDDNVDNILMAHSLRPHSLTGHMTLYKNVLHHSGNKLSRKTLEILGVYVSMLNQCTYCVDHHFAGLRALMDDDHAANEIRTALEAGKPSEALGPRETALADYAALLTQSPHLINESHIVHLREVGLDDGEILEANQVVAYFCYANRTVLGLGVNTNGDVLGLSPQDTGDPNNWGHQEARFKRQDSSS